MIYLKKANDAQRIYVHARDIAKQGDAFTLTLENEFNCGVFDLSLQNLAGAARWYVFDITNAEEFPRGFYRYRLKNERGELVANGLAVVDSSNIKKAPKEKETKIIVKQYGE